MNNTAFSAITPHISPRDVALCLNLDSLDLRISRIMQKYMHNHENPLIMLIMVLTIILTMAAHAQTPVSTLATLQTAITNAADGETITITN
ncbi:MAG: hypothetical protein LBB36_06865, partial [Fibromonadaceae bacterium]|nr:hypothetical protein [Fibromonadaceae bacterium]